MNLSHGCGCEMRNLQHLKNESPKFCIFDVFGYCFVLSWKIYFNEKHFLSEVNPLEKKMFSLFFFNLLGCQYVTKDSWFTCSLTTKARQEQSRLFFHCYLVIFCQIVSLWSLRCRVPMILSQTRFCFCPLYLSM